MTKNDIQTAYTYTREPSQGGICPGPGKGKKMRKEKKEVEN